MANTEPSGVMAIFKTPHELIEAAKKVKDANYYFETYTPFPVHGMDDLMNLKRSWLPFITLGAGLTGLLIAFGLQYWTSAIYWPIDIGGKPYNSWPAWVPVMFELTVLLAGLSTVGAMFVACGLPNTRRKIHDPQLTNNRFALVVEPKPNDPLSCLHWTRSKMNYRSFNEGEVQNLLSGLGAQEVRTVFDEGWF